MITGEGIDVSHWQDIQDAAALRAAVTGGYAWVKVYDGNPARPIEETQVSQLRDGGFKVGGYGFIRDNVPASQQATDFMAALARTDVHDIVPMVDLEAASVEQGGFPNSQAGADRASAAGRHICQVLRANGYSPIVYSNEAFFKMLRVGTWGFPVLKAVAHYSRQPSIPHDVWQRGDKFTLPGLAPGNTIDRNTAFVDLTARKEGPMAWRVARSLDTLLAQINKAFPNRNKASDGSIGDTAHSNRNSDHNPWYGPGIVTARDFTHDPDGGLNCYTLAAQLVASRDPRIKYIIWDRKILDSRPGNNPWKWMPYSGANPHTKHLHLSVMPNASADSTAAWNLGGGGGSTPGQPEKPKTPKITEEDEMQYAPTNGASKSQGLVVPTGASELAFMIAWVNAALKHVKFYDMNGKHMPTGDQFGKTVKAGAGYRCNVPDGAVYAEVDYSIPGTDHAMGSNFRSDI